MNRELHSRRPVETRRRRLALGAFAALPFLIAAGCAVRGAATPSGDTARSGLAGTGSPLPAQAGDRLPSLPREARGARYLLLGELHDNPGLHRLRLDWLEQLVVETRFALAMEQFDANMQASLDATRERLAEVDATQAIRSRQLAEAAGFSFDGWDWALYGPVVEFALREDLPLVAANLSNAQTAQVARGRAESIDASPPAGWSEADAGAMRAAIVDGHCGLLPEAAVAGMVRAQIARDRTMARAACEAARRTRLPVVLLAGNGHVRADIGVPRHLAEFDRDASIVAIGLGEDAHPPVGRFDGVWSVAPVSRADPCAALRERFGGHRR